MNENKLVIDHKIYAGVEAAYNRNAAGCCLHIVLDDFNIDDDDILHCITYALGEGCTECYILANRILFLSHAQRKQLVGDLD